MTDANQVGGVVLHWCMCCNAKIATDNSSPMDATTFALLAADSALSTAKIEAARLVLVDGWALTSAANHHGMAVPGLSRVVSKLRKRAGVTRAHDPGGTYTPKLECVREWVAAATLNDPQAITAFRTLYRAFRADCGRPDIGTVDFGNILDHLGYPRADGCEVAVHSGLRMHGTTDRPAMERPAPVVPLPTFSRETGPTSEFMAELAEARRLGRIARGELEPDPDDQPAEPRVRRVIRDLNPPPADDGEL